jgi:hypothetical protein
MGRAPKPNIPTKSTGDLHYAEEVNAVDTAIDSIVDDYVSQTDAEPQNLAGNLVITSGKTVDGVDISELKADYDTHVASEASGVASGSNPIVTPHGLSGTPTIVTLGAKALQPYALGWKADAINITIYHNAAGSLTVSWIAKL